MNEWTQPERRLISRLQDEHCQIYERLRSSVESYLLDFVAMNIRYFTSHGRRHSLGVIQQLNNLLPEEALASLSSTEALVLLCAAWLHDIGLLVNQDRRTGQTLTYSEIRDRHPQLGRDIIIDTHDEAGIADHVLATWIADVCFCHSRKAGMIDDYFPNSHIKFEHDSMRPRFLAALLRLADGLDMGENRAPHRLIPKLAEFPPDARLHWDICRVVRVDYDGETIILSASAKTDQFQTADDYRRLFYFKFSDLADEFRGVRDILQENGLPYNVMEGRLIYFPDDSSGRRVETVRDDAIPQNEVFPLEVILYDRFGREHMAQGEYIFAADWCYQAGRFYERDKGSPNPDRAKQYYTQAADYIRKHRNASQNDRYWSNLLEHYYDAKAREIGGEPVGDLVAFLADMDTLERQFDLIEEQLGSFFGDKPLLVTHLLLKMGHSPLREALRFQLETIAHNLRHGELHKDCPYCFGWAVSDMWLAEKGVDFRQILQWLRAQGSDKEWRSRQGITYGYNYTASALLGLMDANDPAARKAFDLLMDPSRNWDDSRDNPWSDAQFVILYACSMFWRQLNEETRLKYRNALATRITKFLKRAKREFEQPTKKVLDYYSLVENLGAVSSGLLLGVELSEQVQRWKKNVHDFIIQTFQEYGAIGHDAIRLVAGNPEENLKWMWGWVSYWDYELLRREWEKGKINNTNEEAIE